MLPAAARSGSGTGKPGASGCGNRTCGSSRSSPASPICSCPIPRRCRLRHSLFRRRSVALPVVLLILYPQLRFKPQTRTVTIGTSGITTVVGRKSGRISWKNIRSVTEDRGYVVVQGSSGNAFIIPPRAFETPEAKGGTRRDDEGAGRAREIEVERGHHHHPVWRLSCRAGDMDY